jgi:hypothetical protein
MTRLAKNTVHFGLIFLLAACDQTPTSEQPAPVQQSQHALSTQSILFVVGSTTLTAEDANIKQRLETLGPSVVVVGHNAAATSAIGRSMVLVSPSTSSTILGTRFTNVTAPVFVMNPRLYDEMSMGAHGNTLTSTGLTISTPSHPTAAGLTGTVTPVPLGTSVTSTSSVASGAIVVARLAGNNQPSIFAIDAGSALLSGTAPARRLGWFGGLNGMTTLTTQGVSLFNKAVEWTIGGFGDSECQGRVNGTACNDDNACTTADSCNNGFCNVSNPVVCNDNNVCTTNTCNPITGCGFSAVSNGTSCNDTSVCNGAETCQSGQCISSPALNCDDGNPCTTDSCDGTAGCTNVFVPGPGCAAPALLVIGANAAPADDELLRQRLVSLGFTVKLVNDTAVTASQANAASLVVISESTLSTNVGTRLTGITRPLLALDQFLFDELGISTEFSATSTSTATIVNASHSSANGQTGTVMTTTAARSHNAPFGLASGANVIATVGAANRFMVVFEYGSSLTTGIASARIAALGFDKTTPSVLTAAGWALFDGAVRWLADPRCAGVPNGGICNDGDACQLNDMCQDGVCKGQPLVCNDNNTCNGVEVCQAGACTTGTTLNCDDGNACTADSCDAVTGCGHTNVLGPSCPLHVLMVVGSTTLSANDLSIQSRLTGLGLGVTVVDHNAPATAAANHEMVLISPSTSTTILGTRYTNMTVPVFVMNYRLYDEMSMGSHGVTSYSTGLTISTPSHPAAAGLTGTISPVPAGTLVASTSSVASGATVVASLAGNNQPAVFAFDAGSALLSGTAPARRLGWFGTTSTMTVLTTQGASLFNKAVEWTIGGFGDAQCLGRANGTACNDGSACTTGDACQNAFCMTGVPVNCDDGNVCTTDACVAATGCTHGSVANGTSCSDSNVCNGSEQCQSGSCAAGSALSCDDGDPCTVDSCNMQSGCAHTASTQSCLAVLLVVGDEPLAPVDELLRTHLTTSGYVVVTSTDDAVVAANGTGKVLVVVSPTTDFTVVGTKLNVLTVPLLNMNGRLLTNFGLSSGQAYPIPIETVTVTAPWHPAAALLRGRVAIHDDNLEHEQQMILHPIAPGATIVATMGSTEAPLSMLVERGASLVAAVPSPARRGWFGLYPASASHLSQNGWFLFSNLAYWLATPPGCGAGSTEWCDDGNPCTTNDRCSNGACAGTSNPGVCALQPQIGCVWITEGARVAYVGYTNPTSATITVPESAENTMFPPPFTGALPTTFLPGEHRVVAEIAMISGANLTWRLGDNVVSTETAQACCSDILPSVPPSSPDVVFNDDSETCNQAWRDPSGSEVTYVTDSARGQCQLDSGRVQSFSGSAPTPARTSWFSLIPVTPDQPYCVRAAIKWVGGNRPYLDVLRYNAGMTFLGARHPMIGGDGDNGLGGTSTEVLSDPAEYRVYTSQFSVPAGTSFVQLENGTRGPVSKPGNPASYFDAIRVTRGECGW